MINFKTNIVLIRVMNKKIIKKMKIKNPQKTVLRRWLLIDAFFIILGINSFLNFDINSADGMFIMVSITIVLTSLFFIKSTIKNVKVLNEAINNQKMIVHWKYSAKEWANYLVHEEKYRFEEGKLIAMVLSVITAIVFIPFILIISEGKLAMFLVMLGLFGLYLFMGFIFPKINFYLKKKIVGEVILLEKGVLLNKQFHTWDFLLSKFVSAKLLKKPYEHLAISYNFVDRTGPRNYCINVPIPKSNKKDIKVIISKFK